VLNGGVHSSHRYDLLNLEAGQVEDHLRLISLEVPEFELDLSVDWLETGLEVHTTVSCATDRFEDYIQLYLVVFETSVTAYTGSNGDSHFRNVVLDMLPNAAGKLLENNWYKGMSDSRSNFWTYKSYVEDIEDLAIAAFVQDRGTGKILQAAVNYQDKTVGAPNQISRPGIMNIYPNPAFHTIYVNLGDRTTHSGRIEVMDMSGKMVMEEQVPAGYQVIEMNIEDLDRGIYILHWLESGKVSGVSKMVKTR